MESSNQDLRYLNAKKQVNRIKGFYIHLVVYVTVNLIIILVNQYEDAPFSSMDNYWTAIYWGIGLACHGLSVFLPNFIFGKNWEERKIKEILNK